MGCIAFSESARNFWRNGHHKHHDGYAEHENHDGNGDLIGNFHAANASSTAREHAADGSMVGLLAIYAKAVALGDEGYETEEDQQQRLGEISNKSYFDPSLNEGDGADIVDVEVVKEVNRLLEDDNLPAAEEEE